MTPRVVWVDVFASAPLTGNPLAVVLEADGWETGRMQSLAAELGLSETVFALPPAAGGDAALRIFTPVSELPVAGHPVVGAAWVLHHAARAPARARLETGAGPLEVRVRGAVATMEQPPPRRGPEVDAAEVAAALGAAAASAPAARVWSTGVPQLMLPVEGVAALEGARPDHPALERLGERDGWLGVSAFAVEGGEGGRLRARVRHFAPRLGVPEDPVTGSAAGALGACLADAGHSGGDHLELVVDQRTAAGRGGRVAVRVDLDGAAPARVRVGGRVTPVLEGILTLP